MPEALKLWKRMMQSMVIPCDKSSCEKRGRDRYKESVQILGLSNLI